MGAPELVSTLPGTAGGPETPFGVEVYPAGHPRASLARAIEAEVFAEFFGNTPELLDAEYRAYDPASVFLCVLDNERGAAAGMIRLIEHSAAGFKSLDDIERAWDEPRDEVIARSGVSFVPDQVWDVATLAVAPAYRGSATDGLMSLALYQAVTTLAGQRGIRWLVTVLDLVVLDLIQSRTGRPFQVFAGIEPRTYLDSPASLPVWCDLHEYRRRVAITDRAMHDLLFEGRGLETVVSLPAWPGSTVAGTEPSGARAGLAALG
jgi:hypothetical protein